MRALRVLFDKWPDIAALGELGAAEDANRDIADYASGGDKLNMCRGADLQACKADAGFIRRHFWDRGRCSACSI